MLREWRAEFAEKGELTLRPGGVLVKAAVSLGVGCAGAVALLVVDGGLSRVQAVGLTVGAVVAGVLCLMSLYALVAPSARLRLDREGFGVGKQRTLWTDVRKVRLSREKGRQWIHVETDAGDDLLVFDTSRAAELTVLLSEIARTTRERVGA